MKRLILFLIAFPILLSAQTTRYVNQAAAGTPTGLSWTDAFTDLQVALAAAAYGDTIRIAGGVYTPAPALSTDRTATFFLKNGVAILGGYSGNAAEPEERDPATWQTILYGNIGDPEVFTDNVYSVITAAGTLDERTVLDGLSVAGGYGNNNGGGGLTGGSGTGETQHFQVRNCSFFACHALIGGAVGYFLKSGSRPRFEFCDFYENSAELEGGAMYLHGQGPEAIECQRLFFENNTAPTAPDLEIIADAGTKSVRLSQCVFSVRQFGNPTTSGIFLSAQQDTTAIEVDSCTFSGLTGGPILNVISEGKILVHGCTFTNNKTADFKDLITLDPTNGAAAKTTVEDCVFEKNSGFRLGYFTGGSATVRGCTFRNNSTAYVLYFQNSSAYHVEQCLFTGNNANSALLHTHSAGDLAVHQSIFHQNTTVLFTAPSFNINAINRTHWAFCTFTGNAWRANPPSTPYLFNFTNVDSTFINSCLLADQHPSKALFQKTDAGAIVLSHSLLAYPPTQNVINNTAVLFADSTNLRGSQPIFTLVDTLDLHLMPCSPGLNSGDPGLVAGFSGDFAGASRSLNGAPDIGAYETLLFVGNDTVIGSCTDHPSGRVQYGGNACPPFTYFWSDGLSSGSDSMGMPPGTFALTITDANGIVFYDSITIGSTPLEASIVEALLVQCFGLADGVASAELTAGQPPFQYHWDNGQTTLLAFGLPAGPLALTVTDAHGCTTVAEGAISGPLLLAATVSVQPASMPGASDGLLALDSVAGGMPPYYYAWNTGATGTVLSNLPAGDYTVTLTDANGCQLVLTASVDALVRATVPASAQSIRLLPTIVAAGGSSELKADASSIEEVWVFNMAGQLLRCLQPSATRVTLSAGDLVPGFYLVRAMTRDGSTQTFWWQVR